MYWKGRVNGIKQALCSVEGKTKVWQFQDFVRVKSLIYILENASCASRMVLFQR
jgi:hypothetical protein